MTRVLGKQKAMDMILTSDTLSGKELWERGLVARVWTVNELLGKTVDLATKIARRSGPVVQLAKQAVLNSELLKNISSWYRF